MEKTDDLQFHCKNENPQTFDHVNNHRWDKATEALAPHIHHRVSGDHVLGGERHDKDLVRRWFERLGRVLPNLCITVTDVTVKGWPWNTKVFAQWDGKATLNNGAPYINRGLHVFTLRWGKVYALEEFQEFTGGGQWPREHRRLPASKEAAAAPILS